VRELIAGLIEDALRAAVDDGALALEAVPDVFLERPRDPSHGDYATNVAMQLAKPARMAPRAIAEEIVRRLLDVKQIEAVEIAGPGFINIRLSADVLRDMLPEIHAQGHDFGRSSDGGGRKVQVEFVSANPVGPMHVGHGRWAALGDSIAKLLDFTGYVVEREFYVNDAGVQMDTFAKSVAARYLELCGSDIEFGKDWYRGAYIIDIAREIFEAEGDRYVEMEAGSREAIFMERAYEQVLAHLKRVLYDFGVDFDVWFSERTLHAAGEIESSIARLRESGHVFDADGAVWFRSTDFGDDKDRVLKKADGSYTYFAADIAYHADKLDRGFDLIIDIWGADHHGYVKRMESAVEALGHPGALEVIIGQLVNLFRGGEVVRMSKRTGEMVTFEDLIDEVGVDATRYFFLMRSTDQPLDFDITLAKEQSSENPVYYVQYAHARICSILRKAVGLDARIDVKSLLLESITDSEKVDPERLSEAAELSLMRKLGEFAEVVEVAARMRAPHKLTRYAEDLAASFHQFYTQCRVVSEDEGLTASRLYLVAAARIVLDNALTLLGVSAPERM